MSTIKADTISNLAGSSTTSMNNVVNGSAKAWVNFNGIGTPSIRSSYNVSSITDGGVGNYNINFTTAMPDANYTQVSSAGTSGTSGLNWIAPYGFTNTVNACRVVAFTATFGATFDVDIINVVIFR